MFFFLIHAASNAGSELFISTDDKPDSKTLISEVDGGFPTHQYEYDRYENKLSVITSTHLDLQLYPPVSFIRITSLIANRQNWKSTTSLVND